MKLKGIDGGPHKRWSMWFNSMIREEPYQGLECGLTALEIEFPSGRSQGAAWLSSARARGGVRLSPITSAPPCR